MQNNSAQDINHLRGQLTDLLARAKAGEAGDTLAQAVQDALDTLDAVATQDPLTGALNRRGLVLKLEAELDRAKRTGHPFSMAVIAVDQFHALTERYGSTIGNQVLKNLTQSTLTLIRTLDSFGRISDNEFALILPTTWLDQSDKAIARLTTAVTALDWVGIAPELAVTFSTGLTTNFTGDTAEEMLLRASQALTLAKAKGPGSIEQLDNALPDLVDPGMF